MELTRYEFELLAFVERQGKRDYHWRELVEQLPMSDSAITAARASLAERGLLAADGAALSVTQAGLDALEPYRVQRAVFFAAGFGSRMVPVTLTTPKPLVKVNGVRIIDRMIDAMVAIGITDITIVRGYLKEKFDVLLEKYPFLHFIDNDRYSQENNISSALLAGEKVDRCYICSGDLLVSNPDIFRKYHYRTNYLASRVLETDDWCFDDDHGFAANYRKGGTHCFNQYEIAYWDAADSARLRQDWQRAYATEGGFDLFWEFVPLVLYHEDYQVEIRQCEKTDVMEIDNFHELVALDPSYEGYGTEPQNGDE